MNRSARKFWISPGAILALAVVLALFVSPALAGEYDDALHGVKGAKVVFDVSVGSPKAANVIFWAVRDSYQNQAVQGLSEKPQVAVVFHGPAVKLISSVRAGGEGEAAGEAEKFHELVRQLNKDGVKLEVCLYAARVMGVDPASILPEVRGVGNGFISVIGYQAQGYAVVRIP